MYNKGRKQYIFKLSNGKTYNIFYKEGFGIYTSTLNKRNLWVDSILLIKDTNPNFSAAMDKEDNIYILYQDKHGNIVRVCYKNDNVKSKPVLNSKNPTAYNKYLQVLCSKNEVYFFYVLEYSGNKLLSYQIQNSSGNVSTPKVIDYVHESEVPYLVFQDLENKIYVAYKGNDMKKPQLGLKKYILEKDQWSEFKSIADDSPDCDLLSAAADMNHNIQLLWQKKVLQKYELMYSYKAVDSTQWEESKSIASGSHPYNSASLLPLNDMLLCYWVNDNVIYYMNRSNANEFWSKAERYDFYTGKPCYCMQYQSNVLEDTQCPFSTEIPGNFVGSYKLAFINDAELKPGTPNLDEVRVLFADTLKNLSKNMDDVKQTIIQLKNKLEEMESKQSQTEMELSKLSIKSSLIDNDLSKLKGRADWVSRPKEQADTSLKLAASEAPAKDPGELSNIAWEIYGSSTPSETNPSPAGSEFAIASDIKKIPVMPGTGFSGITPEFLQKLAKK